jgi:manganese catalase
VRPPGGACADGLPARPRRRPPSRLRTRGRAADGRPAPRIPTDKIPECKPHLDKGLDTKLYRFSPNDYKEIVAVFTGPHPETGKPLEVVDEAPEGFPPHDLPSQPAVFAPDYAPEEIKEIAQKLRKKAGLPDEPLGVVASSPENGGGLGEKIKNKVT